MSLSYQARSICLAILLAVLCMGGATRAAIVDGKTVDLPSACGESDAAGDVNNVTQVTCSRPALESHGENTADSPTFHTLAFGSPNCYGYFTALSDGFSLCYYLTATSVTLAPAYSPTTCHCETYAYGRAVLAACNCDHCSTSTISNLGTWCYSILSTCGRGRSAAGQVGKTRPTTYINVYENGLNQGAPPDYTACSSF